MTKSLIVFFLGLSSLFISFPRTESYIKIEPPVKVVAIKSKATLKHRTKEKYSPPTGTVLSIAEKVAKETHYPVDTISKIMWAESRYNAHAVHRNKNKTTDHGYFQINSSHIPLARSLYIDIFTEEGNTQFAIYLLQSKGLAPWRSSMSNWSM